jgi:hypothetical protein
MEIERNEKEEAKTRLLTAVMYLLTAIRLGNQLTMITKNSLVLCTDPSFSVPATLTTGTIQSAAVYKYLYVYIYVSMYICISTHIFIRILICIYSYISSELVGLLVSSSSSSATTDAMKLKNVPEAIEDATGTYVYKCLLHTS